MERFGVGREVDAVCRPCGEVRGHIILAMGEDRQGNPKPVRLQCLGCKAQHGYRPPEKLEELKTPLVKPPPKAVRRGDLRATRREDIGQKAAPVSLQEELADAEETRPYSPHNRYRVGQIIEHADFGRGKVEMKLRGHIVVQFAGRQATLKAR